VNFTVLCSVLLQRVVFFFVTLERTSNPTSTGLLVKSGGFECTRMHLPNKRKQMHIALIKFGRGRTGGGSQELYRPL
jgi:hypothetical protein